MINMYEVNSNETSKDYVSYLDTIIYIINVMLI